MHDKSSPPSASAWFTFKAMATAARDSNVSRLSKALGASLAEQVQACFTHVLRTGRCELLKGRTLAAWCLPKPESCRLVMKAIVSQRQIADIDQRYMQTLHGVRTGTLQAVGHKYIPMLCCLHQQCMQFVFTLHAISIIHPSVSPALLGLSRFSELIVVHQTDCCTLTSAAILHCDFGISYQVCLSSDHVPPHKHLVRMPSCDYVSELWPKGSRLLACTAPL